MTAVLRLAIFPLTLAVSGCVSTLSGLGGAQSYACQAPVGAQCTSISGIYAHAVHGMSEVPRPAEPLAAANKRTTVGEPTKDTAAYAGMIGATRSRAPERPPKSPPPNAPTAATVPTPMHAAVHAAINDATALRSAPRALRLWIAPWEDSDGDLHDASVVHVVVDHGHWLIDRVRPASRTRLDGIKPPAAMLPPSHADASAVKGRAEASRGATVLGPDVLPSTP